MANSRTIFFLILSIITGFIYAFWQSQPDEFVNQEYLFYISRVFYIFASLALIEIISKLVVQRFLGKKGNKIPSALLRNIVNLTLYFIFAALILKFGFHMKLAALITTSALLTAVLGFAMQSTLGNIFSGLSLQLEQIFYIGDTVNINDTMGKIESLTWRSVSLRTADNSLIVIPNSKISSSNVEVFPAEMPVLVNIKIPVPMTEYPQNVKKIIKNILDHVPHIIKDKPIIINLDSIIPTKRLTEYSIICFCDNFLLRFSVMSIIKERILYSFIRNRINLADIYEAEKFFEVPEIRTIIPRGDHLDIISNTYLFEPLLEEEKIYLSDNSEPYIYASGEPILFEKGIDKSILIVADGKVKVKYPVEFIDESKLFTDNEENVKAEENIWNPLILREISERLIQYIGPIGEYIVAETSEKVLDPYRLYMIVSNEINDPKQRRLFLEGIPEAPSMYLLPQDTFGESRILGEDTVSNTHYEALGQVELIAIKPDIIKDIVERRPEIIEDLTDRILHNLKKNPEFYAFSKDQDIKQKIYRILDPDHI